MNKLGVHAFVWEKGWSKDECARAIGKTAEVGFDLIEVSIMDPRAVDTAFTCSQLEKAGIGATYSFGLDDSCDISSNDPAKIKAGEAKLNEAVAMARDIGATHIAGILFSAFQKYAVPTTSEGVARSVEVLQRVAENAAKSDIAIGLEVVNRYETNVLNTASQGVAMCKRIGAPNVKVHLDVYHMNIEESDIQQAILETGDHLGYFHTGDSHRGYMGSGSIDSGGRVPGAGQIRLHGADHLRVLLVPRRRPAARGHPGHLAQSVGGQPRPRQSCAHVHAGADESGAGSGQAGRAQPPPLSVVPRRVRMPLERCERNR